MTPKEELETAKKIIAEKGRVSCGSFYSQINDCYCTAGALMKAKGVSDAYLAGLHEETDPTEWAVAEQKARPVMNGEDPAMSALITAVTRVNAAAIGGGPGSLYIYNDDHCKEGIDPIFALIDKAIEIVEGNDDHRGL